VVDVHTYPLGGATVYQIKHLKIINYYVTCELINNKTYDTAVYFKLHLYSIVSHVYKIYRVNVNDTTMVYVRQKTPSLCGLQWGLY